MGKSKSILSIILVIATAVILLVGCGTKQSERKLDDKPAAAAKLKPQGQSKQFKKTATFKTPIGDKKPLSADEAATLAKAFAEASSVELSDQPVFQGQRPTYEFRTDDNRVVWVDAKAGIITGVVGPLKEEPVKKEDLPLSKKRAIERAEDFVKDKYPWFDFLTLVEVERGPNYVYIIKWQNVDENGVNLPMWVYISVDSNTGALGSYSARAQDATISTKPKITEKQAVDISGLSNEDTLEGCGLTLVNDKSGKQRLVWVVSYVDRTKVKLPSSEDAFTVSGTADFIDALTGNDITRDIL